MPYNVERILLMASNMSTDRVKNIMAEFESNPNGTKIPEDILTSIQAHVVGTFLLKVSSLLNPSILLVLFLDTMSVDDPEIEATILKCSQENGGYVLCPHTATAVKYFYEKNQTW